MTKLTEGQLESQLCNLFRRMSVCAAEHQRNKDNWIDGQCVTPSTAAKKALELFEAHMKLTRQKTIEEIRSKLPTKLSTAELQSQAMLIDVSRANSRFNMALAEINQILNNMEETL